jgi:hypothetical protein
MSNTTLGLTAGYYTARQARLVQEGNRLHYLADRASITVSSVKPNARSWMKLSALYQPDGIDADLLVN